MGPFKSSLWGRGAFGKPGKKILGSLDARVGVGGRPKGSRVCDVSLLPILYNKELIGLTGRRDDLPDNLPEGPVGGASRVESLARIFVHGASSWK